MKRFVLVHDATTANRVNKITAFAQAEDVKRCRRVYSAIFNRINIAKVKVKEVKEFISGRFEMAHPFREPISALPFRYERYEKIHPCIEQIRKALPLPIQKL